MRGIPLADAAATTPPSRALCRLPLAVGAGVLLLCWLALFLRLAAESPGCFGEEGLWAGGGKLARGFGIGDGPVAAAIALAAYAALCFAPFALLWGCAALAARLGARRQFVAVQSIAGSALSALFFAVAFWIAADDLVHPGMFCDLSFDLTPFAGLIAGAGAAVIATLLALIVGLIGRRPA